MAMWRASGFVLSLVIVCAVSSLVLGSKTDANHVVKAKDSPSAIEPGIVDLFDDRLDLFIYCADPDRWMRDFAFRFAEFLPAIDEFEEVIQDVFETVNQSGDDEEPIELRELPTIIMQSGIREFGFGARIREDGKLDWIVAARLDPNSKDRFVSLVVHLNEVAGYLIPGDDTTLSYRQDASDSIESVDELSRMRPELILPELADDFVIFGNKGSMVDEIVKRHADNENIKNRMVDSRLAKAALNQLGVNDLNGGDILVFARQQPIRICLTGFLQMLYASDDIHWVHPDELLFSVTRMFVEDSEIPADSEQGSSEIRHDEIPLVGIANWVQIAVPRTGYQRMVGPPLAVLPPMHSNSMMVASARFDAKSFFASLEDEGPLPASNGASGANRKDSLLPGFPDNIEEMVDGTIFLNSFLVDSESDWKGVYAVLFKDENGPQAALESIGRHFQDDPVWPALVQSDGELKMVVLRGFLGYAAYGPWLIRGKVTAIRHFLDSLPDESDFQFALEARINSQDFSTNREFERTMKIGGHGKDCFCFVFFRSDCFVSNLKMFAEIYRKSDRFAGDAVGTKMFDVRVRLAELLLNKFGNLKIVMSNHDSGILTTAHFLGIRMKNPDSNDSK